MPAQLLTIEQDILDSARLTAADDLLADVATLRELRSE